jgi:hypothetical protein
MKELHILQREARTDNTINHLGIYKCKILKWPKLIKIHYLCLQELNSNHFLIQGFCGEMAVFSKIIFSDYIVSHAVPYTVHAQT